MHLSFTVLLWIFASIIVYQAKKVWVYIAHGINLLAMLLFMHVHDCKKISLSTVVSHLACFLFVQWKIIIGETRKSKSGSHFKNHCAAQWTLLSSVDIIKAQWTLAKNTQSFWTKLDNPMLCIYCVLAVVPHRFVCAIQSLKNTSKDGGVVLTVRHRFKF